MEKNDNTISVKIGENFKLRLEAVPTAGYQWQTKYEETYVKLVSNGFVPSSEMMGAGGVEQYIFNAIKSGNTMIEMVYKRPWEKNAYMSKKFYVKIE